MSRAVQRLPGQTRYGAPRSEVEELSFAYAFHYGKSVNGEPMQMAAGDRYASPLMRFRCTCGAVVGGAGIWDRSQRLPRARHLLIAEIQVIEDPGTTPVTMRYAKVLLDDLPLPPGHVTPTVVPTYCGDHGRLEVAAETIRSLARRTLSDLANGGGADVKPRRLTLSARRGALTDNQ